MGGDQRVFWLVARKAGKGHTMSMPSISSTEKKQDQKGNELPNERMKSMGGTEAESFMSEGMCEC